MNEMLEKYEGSCHCRRVTFEALISLRQVVDCNCSICRLRGALWCGAAESDLRIISGESELTLYQFNTKIAKHYFCRHCGIHPFIRPRLDPGRWAINARCLEGVDMSALSVRTFDGEIWEAAAQEYYGRAKQ